MQLNLHYVGIYRALALTGLIGSSSLASAQLMPGHFLIPADRLPLPGTWEGAGVEDGIPNRTKICADVTEEPYLADRNGTVSAVSAIQRAINECASGEVVYVPAGKYKIDGRIRIQKSITLRGAGPATVFSVTSGNPILMDGILPWPPPKNNRAYLTDAAPAPRGANEIVVANATAIQPGMMILVDEQDDPSLVWTKSGNILRSRGSLHLVESKQGPIVTFRPPLPIEYRRSPHVAWLPHVLSNAGVEDIRFLGNGFAPTSFIDINSAWNVWVKGAEFSNMPSKTIVVAWAGHVELRKNYLHDQSNGGPGSEGLDLLADVNWSLVVDNICSAGGFPGINIGDGGASSNYSGGFGNVVAYNYCVDSFYTDPPTDPAAMLVTDIGINHSPHPQFNLFEGNITGKFGADAYHGSGSHAVLFRNLITGHNKWGQGASAAAVQIDRRNLYFSIVGNVIGDPLAPATIEEATISNWRGSSIFRLGYPDIGNNGYSGTHPPDPLAMGDGGPRDLFVDRSTTSVGTTLIEGNWTSASGRQEWSNQPALLPDSLFLLSKPRWFGGLAWPPIDPAKPTQSDPSSIPAGYRFVHAKDP